MEVGGKRRDKQARWQVDQREEGKERRGKSTHGLAAQAANEMAPPVLSAGRLPEPTVGEAGGWHQLGSAASHFKGERCSGVAVGWVAGGRCIRGCRAVQKGARGTVAGQPAPK